MSQIVLGNIEYSNPFQELEPWEKHILRGANRALTTSGVPDNNDKVVKSFYVWVQGLDLLDMVVYTNRYQETY